jgi:Na+/proline symporter/nitrogen-specific signal transduction histidine kinase
VVIELWWLFIVALLYLGVLFLIAYSADNGILSKSLVEHPAVYALSLGVYATSWTFYGSVGLANQSGMAFLTIYLGVTAAFLLGPYLLKPILRLCSEYQLSSVADLLAFRYGGRATGFAVTLFLLVGILPYISLQINAVTQSIQVLAQQAAPNLLALAFCVITVVFAVLFGARHITPREKHTGLVVAIAFESAIKLIALLVAGMVAIVQVFGGVEGMNDWLAMNPEQLEAMYHPVKTSLWSTLLLLAFGAAFLLPRQYHMTFVENHNPKALNTAYWLFPLYLLLLNLPIFPILWAGKTLGLDISPDFYVLGMAMSVGDQWLALLVYLGGLSAASAMMIVTTLALSYMCLNQLLLPLSISTNNPDTNLYKRLLWSKRVIIAAIIAAGYGFYLVIEVNQGLASLGLISFVAAIQLLPGVIGLLFWTRATQAGLLLGLLGGATVWFAFLVWPLLTDSASITSVQNLIGNMGFEGVDVWSISTFCSLTVNCFLYVVGSLLTTPTNEEQEAAQACVSDALRPLHGLVNTRSASEYSAQLKQLLGSEAAQQEVSRAMNDLKLQGDHLEPAEMRLLHERLERNLSGLLGPTVARLTLRGNLQLTQPANQALTESLRAMETRLETSRKQMRGMTKELDDLRLYLRNVLHELPLGVCSIGPSDDVLIWNQAMQQISGIDEKLARRSKLQDLPAPWNQMLKNFSASQERHVFRQHADLADGSKTFNFHKSHVNSPVDRAEHATGQVILVEDRTNVDLLESELAHSERLASIGRLAAGIAHEIGNPLTGIASIAQNLSYDSDHNSVRENSTDILTQVSRINAIVRSLLTFARNEPSLGDDRESVDLRSSVEQAIQLVSLAEQAKSVNFNIRLDEGLLVHANAGQMVQVFVNLLNNACDVSDAGGTIDIEGWSGAEVVTVRIRDYGPGISIDEQQRVFEPFYTTKAVGQGTGLGLPMVYSLIVEHGGKIVIDQSVSDGVCFEISLPAMSSVIDKAG